MRNDWNRVSSGSLGGFGAFAAAFFFAAIVPSLHSWECVEVPPLEPLHLEFGKGEHVEDPPVVGGVVLLQIGERRPVEPDAARKPVAELHGQGDAPGSEVAEHVGLFPIEDWPAALPLR